jgi:hypothetical protein
MPMTFARRVYLIAGIYGLIVLLPQYLLEERNSRDFPPAITHPEYYYGFVGVGIAWQLAFLVIATDPARYRPMMVPSVVEKASFGFAAIALYHRGRLALPMLVAATIDLILGVLFLIAFVRTPPRRERIPDGIIERSVGGPSPPPSLADWLNDRGRT